MLLIEEADAITIDDGEIVLFKAVKDGIRPDPIMTISEWADAHRVLPQKAAAEPGRWRTIRTPYLREIMDALSPMSPTREVVFMAGAQVGKTECGNNFLGYVIDYCPAPMMMVQPTVDLAKRLSKQRVDPMIAECPRLSGKVADSRARDSGNTVLSKDFPGGTVIMTGANSAVGLRSMPARFLFLDEIDGFPGDVKEEGDPIELAERRTSTFRNRKILKTSTPTVTGKSKIEDAYYDANATQEVYKLPCPHCEEKQQLVWKGIKWNKEDPTEVWYECVHCEGRIEEHQKTWMLENGEWVAQNPGADGTIRSFHVSSLYSPVGWFSWADAVRKWNEAGTNPAKLKTFINTVLGEAFKEKGEAPKWEALYRRREPYAMNTVPREGLVLTAGVDVQGDRLEAEIVAWGRDFRNWSIDYRVFPGDPTKSEVWANLENMLVETWPHESGVDMRLQRMAVDSGYATQAVYSWVRRQSMERVMATKGQERQRVLVGHPTAVDVNYQGRKISRGTQVWNIGVGLAKEELYGWLRQEEPINPDKDGWPQGWSHFPEYAEEFFKQMCAEEITWTKLRGYRKPVWEKTRERNEALDCRVMARVAAAVVGIDRWPEEQWDLVETSLGILNEAPAADRPSGQREKRRGGYLNSYGRR